MLRLKMLPVEILILVFIADRTRAVPRAWPPVIANSTSSSVTRTSPPSSYLTFTTATPPEITESSSDEGQPTLDPEETCTDGCVVDCATAMCSLFPVQNEVPTETGFEDTSTMSIEKTVTASTMRPTTTAMRSGTNNNVLTTSAPLVVDVQTNTAPSAANAPPVTNGQPVPSGVLPDPSAFRGPSSSSLLAEIISILGRPVLEPPNPSTNQVLSSNETPQRLQQQDTAADFGASITPAPGARPTVQLGQSMTFAGAIVTLTPGLSTTVGDGPAATYIAITTDAAGQTTIMISSSGTAVTATVKNVPTTITITSSTDLSVTGVGGPANSGVSSGRAPISTSNVAGAPKMEVCRNFITKVMVLLAGLGVAIWE